VEVFPQSMWEKKKEEGGGGGVGGCDDGGVDDADFEYDEINPFDSSGDEEEDTPTPTTTTTTTILLPLQIIKMKCPTAKISTPLTTNMINNMFVIIFLLLLLLLLPHRLGEDLHNHFVVVKCKP